jgi:hypothetical protein
MSGISRDLQRIIFGITLGVFLVGGVTRAQTSSSSPTPTPQTEPVPTDQTVGLQSGNFTIVSSMEFGYRGQRVDGDINKFKSDLNYKAGARLFDTSFLMKSKNGGQGEPFDTFLITTTGWGADPSGNVRIDVEHPKWYRFEGQYRRFKYYRFLNNIANPTWLFSPIQTVANPVTGLHGFDIYTQMGDFDLTLLPKNEKIRFNIGYSPERYSGPFYTNYHNGGNDFWLLANARSRADDWRFGADGKIGQVDWTFVEGLRRFRDDTVMPEATGLNRNASTSVAQYTLFNRQEPTRGTINYTRGSLHTLIAKKFDITGRIVYSHTTSNSTYIENFTGTNFNFRITGFPPTPPNAQPNTTNPSFYNITGDVTRPNTVGDVGFTWLATNKLRISNTFRIEDFTIDGTAVFSDFFSLTRPVTGGTVTNTFTASNLPANQTIHYRKYQDIVEGDYQINHKYAFHFGYRYAHRRDEQTLTGNDLSSNAPTLLTTEDEVNSNNTNAIFGGFKAHPSKNFTLYFDAEHGTADNVFTRIGNYDYTNVRAKSRWSPNRRVNLNLGFILRNNSNPSEVDNVSLSDFTTSVKTRIFTSSIDWMPSSRLTINTGYNYNWLNNDAVIQYYYQVPPAASLFHPNGHGLYFQRLNFFYLDLTARLNRRMTLFTSYRLNQDGGQGNRLSDPVGGPAIPGGVIPPGGTSAVAANNGGTLITSMPMTFNSPDARLQIMINRHLDWNLGYSYYSYNENNFLNTFPGSPRAQNYHAHLPYTSLRIYIGRKE